MGPAVRAGTEPPLSAGTPETNRSWRVDETYCRVAGNWIYLYRPVDSTGATIDFLLSATRDAVAAKRFLRNIAFAGPSPAEVINVDGNPSYPKAISELKRSGELSRRCRCRPVRYLNNIVEQDHRRVKFRVSAMVGFKSFENARTVLAGIELIQKLKKGQYGVPRKFGAYSLDIWRSVLAA